MSKWLGWIVRAGLAVLLLGGTQASQAQDEKPTAQQIAAIRSCAEKNQDEITEAERQCLFNLVATPCQSTPEGQSNLGMADCFRLEAKIWDDLLNENYKRLRDVIDAGQAAKLRDMQRAWIASRDTTCGFYDVKIQGSMAIPMGAACLARETARRAVLLKFFTRL
ncbi:MAG: lysozyme inhibitor LprI family protein [Xanthobacteraceae bacterium]